MRALMQSASSAPGRLHAWVRRFQRDENGSVLITFTVMFVVLLGFAALTTDAGTAYWNRRMLQNAMDSAALAGASALPNPTAAVATAIAVAKENGATGVELGAVPNNPRVTSIFGPNDSIVVSAQRLDNTGLRYVSGGGDLTLGAGATAILAPVAPSDVWPVAVQSGVDCSEGCTIKYGAGGGYNGNYGFVDFDITGSGNVGTYITSGYTGVIPTPASYNGSTPVWNWTIASEPGNKVSQTRAFQTLLNWDNGKYCDGGSVSCAGLYVPSPDNSFYPDTPDGTVCYTDVRCPRVGIMPVIAESWSSINGKKSITVIGFQCFYLQVYAQNGQGQGQDTVQAKSLGQCYQGGGAVTAYYGAPINSTGSYAVMLWR